MAWISWQHHQSDFFLANWDILQVNSLAPGKFGWNFRHAIFQQILVIDGWGISSEIVLIWVSLDFSDDQSTLVQVMAWCRQATSHYLSQCWPKSLSPYGITRPQRVKAGYVISWHDARSRPGSLPKLTRLLTLIFSIVIHLNTCDRKKLKNKTKDS